MKSVIETKNAPSAIGPYSQAICFNGILYASGQIPINPDTGDLVENDIEKQTRQVLKILMLFFYRLEQQKIK